MGGIRHLLDYEVLQASRPWGGTWWVIKTSTSALTQLRALTESLELVIVRYKCEYMLSSHVERGSQEPSAYNPSGLFFLPPMVSG